MAGQKIEKPAEKAEAIKKKEKIKTEEIKKPGEKKVIEKPGQNLLLSNIPLYLGILLLIVGLLGGYSLRIITEPEVALPQPSGNGESPGFVPTLRAKLIYSDQCKICGKNNTFELVLISASIPYEMEEIEAGSPEGIRLVGNYNVKTVPTILVEEGSVNPDITVQTKDGQIVKLKELLRSNLVRDKYVIPEMRFDQRAHPIMYLMEVEECSSPEGKINVEIFSDPYDLAEIQLKPVIEEALRDFNELIDFHYNYIASYSANALYPVYGIDDTVLAAEFIYCASEQGKYLEFDRHVRGIYCNKGSIDETTDQELIYCEVGNTRLEKPLTQDEIDNAVEWTNLDLNRLDECRQSVREKFEESEGNAKEFGVISTPSALVDCRYLILTANLKNVICEIRPDEDACKEEAG